MNGKLPLKKQTVNFRWTGYGSKICAEVKCGSKVRAITFINNRLTPTQLIKALEHLNFDEEDNSSQHPGSAEGAGEVQLETRTEEETSEA